MKSEHLIRKLNHFLQDGGKDSPITHSDAFAAFYNETYLSVFRYIYGLTGGPSTEVEDLTAETYMRAWKSREGYRGELSLAIGWVLKIARNLVIDTYRRDKNGVPLNAGPLEEDALSAPPEQHPENRLIASEQQVLVLNLLDKLPSEQREILVLRYLLNWKVQQISPYLEIPENTVSVYIRRALEKLRLFWPTEKE